MNFAHILWYILKLTGVPRYPNSIEVQLIRSSDVSLLYAITKPHTLIVRTSRTLLSCSPIAYAWVLSMTTSSGNLSTLDLWWEIQMWLQSPGSSRYDQPLPGRCY